jgi:hypothetical protein
MARESPRKGQFFLWHTMLMGQSFTSTKWKMKELRYFEIVQRLLNKYVANDEHVIQTNIYFKAPDTKKGAGNKYFYCLLINALTGLLRTQLYKESERCVLLLKLY